MPQGLKTLIAAEAGSPSTVAAGVLNGDGLDDVITTDPVY